jgi:uncharacterized membrane protein YfcA
VDDFSSFAIAAVLLVTLASFTLSASVGLGGSLILVPSLALVLGTKEGVALAALLLGANNIFKVAAYRSSLPFRAAGLVVGMLTVGAVIGATLMVRAPELLVGIAVVASFALSLFAEREGWTRFRHLAAPTLAFSSGATSGFSGTSGPLKGAALRNLDLDRLHFVGAASLASLAGDLAKTAVFANASLLGSDAIRMLVLSFPLMFVGTFLGRRVNSSVGESGFAVLFWSVMTAYSIRLVAIVL